MECDIVREKLELSPVIARDFLRSSKSGTLLENSYQKLNRTLESQVDESQLEENQLEESQHEEN